MIYRPIALTSLFMKAFERLIKRGLVEAVEDILDPLQFAYRRKRIAEVSVLTLLNFIFKYLDSPRTLISRFYFGF